MINRIVSILAIGFIFSAMLWYWHIATYESRNYMFYTLAAYSLWQSVKTARKELKEEEEQDRKEPFDGPSS